MQRKVKCPKCEEKVKIGFNTNNPIQCDQCEAKFNLVTRTVPIRIDIDPEFADKVIAGFSEVGAYSMERLRERFRGWKIFPQEKGKCSACGKEVNLTMEKNGQKYCSTCGQSQLYRGKQLNQELLPRIKEKFYPQIPRKVLIDRAFQKAQSIFGAWLSNNWGKFAVRERFKNQIQECKTKGKRKIAGEPSEITHIREIWRNIRSPISPLKFFEIYYQGRGISKSNRKERREQLQNLSSEDEFPKKKRKCTDLALQVAEPSCSNCEHLEKYEWGWECKLQRALDRWLKIGDFPEFPQNLVDLPNKSAYTISRNKIELQIWEYRVKREVKIIDPEWLERRYNHKEFTSKRYPYLLRKDEQEYYFMYPKRDTIKIVKPGDWNHIISYGPTLTWVLSTNGDQERKRYFEHGKIISIKQYYQAQRKEAQKEAKEYWNKSRKKEGHKVKLTLHNETREITDYLTDFPGRIIILNMQKEKYKREKWKRKQLNQALSWWTEEAFRQRMGYKAELAGFIVEEKKFKVTEKPTCPECGMEFSKNWQYLIITGKKGKARCSGCKKDIDLILEMAKTQANNGGS